MPSSLHEGIAELDELPQALRKTAEDELREGIVYGSDFARSYFAKGEAKGRAEGEAMGRAEGKAEGEEIGETRATADAVLAVLRARGIEFTTSQRSLVLRCGNMAKLEKWLNRAATASSADKVFA